MSKHRVGGGVARGPILLFIVAVLVAGGLADRAIAGHATTAGKGFAANVAANAAANVAGPGGASLAGAGAQMVPVAAPSGSLSSSWFCAGGTDTPANAGGIAPASVLVVNGGTTAAKATVTVVADNGKRAQASVTIGARSQQAVPEAVPGGAGWVGAIVDVDAGATSVEQQTVGPGGLTLTPCATSGSSHWYFASGQTLLNAGVELTLLNPYPADSVVDLTFTTDQGVEAPVQNQALVVPAGGMLAVNLGDHLRRRHSIATTVRARSGRVVAWETQWVSAPPAGAAVLGTPAAESPLADPAAPTPGVTVLLGAASAGTTWVWPEGQAGNGVTEQYVVYNPGAATAQIRLAVQLDQGSAEPFDLTVPPGQVIPVESDQQARIPAGVTHAAVLESTNGVPVVAERTLTATAPSSWNGRGDMFGATLPATRWLIGGVLASARHDSWIVLYNPATKPVRVVLYVLDKGSQVALAGNGGVGVPTAAAVADRAPAAPVPAPAPLLVPPGRRVAIHVNQLRPQLSAPIVVSAAVPVYAEYDSFGINGPGISASSGVPLM